MKKGAVLFPPTDTVQKVFYLKKGRVSQTVTSKDGEAITIHVFEEESIIPLALALSGKNNIYYFEAATNVEVIPLSTITVVKYLKENPNALFDFTVKLSKAVFGLAERLEKSTTMNAYSRVADILSYLGSKEAQSGGKQGLSLTQTDIASWTGLTRETVARQIKKLGQKNLVNYLGRKLIIVDSGKLKKEVEN